MLFVCLLVVLHSLISTSEAARILALVPYNSRSHHVVMAPLFQELSARGHQVTVVSSFPRPNSQDIDLSSDLPVAINNYTLETVKERMPHMFKTVFFISEINLNACIKMLNDKRVLNLLNEKYDLIIGEIFGSDLTNYFAYKMKVPVISFVTSTALPWISGRTGLPDNPAYIPNFFVDYSADMSLWQRTYNAFTLMYAKAAYYYSSEVPTHKLAQEFFGEELPSVEEVNRRTSLVLINSHFSLSQSRPFTPNVIEVGGIHIKEKQDLPQDLQKILNASSEGVILFSLGSLVKVSSLPPQIIRMFLNVFGTLPQRVVFKYEEPLTDVPPNVFVRKWLPQADIVAHPNLVAVVTHGGLASTIEAVHYGKPLVGVPFFSDQFLNIKNVVRRGAGLILDINNLSEKAISESLKAVLYESRYKENMNRLSLMFRDRPISPLQSAVYWSEYVIRHQGAPQLRPFSVNLPFYQDLLLDVMAVLLGSIAALLASIYWIVKLALHLTCKSKKKGSGPKQNVKKSKKYN